MDKLMEFDFDHVVLFKPVFFVIIGVLAMAPLVYFIGRILPIDGAIFGGAALGLIVMVFVFRIFQKSIVITFNANKIYFKINRANICYQKSDVVGFYSFDYKTSTVFTISICIYFKDGRRLNISDYKLKPASMNPKRKQQLINFIKMMEREFAFKPLKENKIRKFFRFGYVWYSR